MGVGPFRNRGGNRVFAGLIGTNDYFEPWRREGKGGDAEVEGSQTGDRSGGLAALADKASEAEYLKAVAMLARFRGIGAITVLTIDSGTLLYAA